MTTDIVIMGCKHFCTFHSEALARRVSERIGSRVHNITCEFTGDRMFDQLVTEFMFLPRCHEGDMVFVQRNELNTSSFVHLQLLVTNEMDHQIWAKGWLFFYKDTCLMGSRTLNLKQSLEKITDFTQSLDNQSQDLNLSELDLKKIQQDVGNLDIPALDLTLYSKLNNIFDYAKSHTEQISFMIKTTCNFHKFHFFLCSVPGFGDTVPKNAGWFAYYRGKLILGMTHLSNEEALQAVRSII